MKELTLEAKIENLEQVQLFVESVLEENGCPMKSLMQISIAVEEIFTNIALYAYGEDTGEARVCVRPLEAGAEITFLDRGMRYDPLQKEDPDVTLTAEERPVGGLGVFMVKKIMDEVRYEYRDGQNVLIMRKNW